MMDARAVIVLVVEMRRAQRTYFVTRSTADLMESKALEKRADAAMREYLAGPTLFGADS